MTALIQLGDYSGADEVLAEMAKAVPDAEQSGAYQVVQSELLRKQGDLPDALDAARKAIGSADGNDQLARAYRLAASICEDIGDSMLSEEINLLNQALNSSPMDITTRWPDSWRPHIFVRRKRPGIPAIKKMPCEPISSWRKTETPRWKSG